MVDIGGLKDDLPLRRPEVQKSYREAVRQTGSGQFLPSPWGCSIKFP